MADVLLTPREAVLLSGIQENFPPCRVDDILQIETEESRDCLGSLYDSLLADKADYSGDPEFVSGSTYNEGDVVSYQGVFYEALATTTALPVNSGAWKFAAKFETAIYNELWVFLGRYLACLAVKASVEPAATKMTGAGLVKTKGDDFDPASSKDIERLYLWLNARIAQAFRNMHHFLLKRKAETALSGYAGFNTCTAACAKYVPDYSPEVACSTGSCGDENCSKCGDAKSSWGGTYNIG